MVTTLHQVSYWSATPLLCFNHRAHPVPNLQARCSSGTSKLSPTVTLAATRKPLDNASLSITRCLYSAVILPTTLWPSVVAQSEFPSCLLFDSLVVKANPVPMEAPDTLTLLFLENETLQTGHCPAPRSLCPE